MLSGLFIGILFGFLLQRGQFCFVSGFRQLYQRKDLRFLTALFIAISIQSVGLFTLVELKLLTIPSSSFPLGATIFGGLIFGVGMVLANCCATGGWFRSAEGVMGSGIALVAFSLTMASCLTGALKHWINPLIQSQNEWNNVYLTLGISPWWCVAVLLLVTLALIIHQIKNPRYRPVQSPSQAVFFPQIFAKPFHPFVTAVLIGLLGIVAWYFSATLTGRNYGFGIAVPSANVVQYVVTGQQRYLNWGSYFVLGIWLGSFVSAKLSGEFQWRVPEPKAVLQRIIGGVLMAIGASLAGGCTVTNSLVATAYFSWQGWLASLMIILGCWLASAFVKTTQCKI